MEIYKSRLGLAKSRPVNPDVVYTMPRVLLVCYGRDLVATHVLRRFLRTPYIFIENYRARLSCAQVAPTFYDVFYERNTFSLEFTGRDSVAPKSRPRFTMIFYEQHTFSLKFTRRDLVAPKSRPRFTLFFTSNIHSHGNLEGATWLRPSRAHV
jgi:hypothetical protein